MVEKMTKDEVVMASGLFMRYLPPEVGAICVRVMMDDHDVTMEDLSAEAVEKAWDAIGLEKQDQTHNRDTIVLIACAMARYIPSPLFEQAMSNLQDELPDIRLMDVSGEEIQKYADKYGWGRPDME